MKVGIIGAGNMGKAIIDRMIVNNVDVLVSSKKEGSYKGIKIIIDNEKVAKNSDVIILTVKPPFVTNIAIKRSSCRIWVKWSEVT